MVDRKYYSENPEKVIEATGVFKYVMAITLDPRTNYKEGIVRCVMDRDGDIQFKGYTSKSKLYKIKGDSLFKFNIVEPLIIKGEEEVVKNLSDEMDNFIGLEDPDIWIDKETNLMHVYFTIPIKPLDEKEKMKIHLGHAVGKDLGSLEMTEPVLVDINTSRAKEVSIAPVNKRGFRYNLVESKDRSLSTSHAVIVTALVHDMGKPWEYGDTAFHPAEHNIDWIAGHASPGPLFPKSFIDIGEGKLVGIINGCQADQMIGDKTKYGDFSIGLFIYDYENGKIDWVSPEPFIQDSEAGKDGGRAITFASQFIETGTGQGILYAHVDDSFVRAYTLKAEDIKSLLPL
ncbi:MAG: hypothetical protein ABL917_00060 [Parcubacteria group bacterium]